MHIALFILFVILFFVAGIIIGWLLAMRILKKQIKEKPLINVDQIKELYRQVGRTPSEKQIQQILENIKQ